MEHKHFRKTNVMTSLIKRRCSRKRWKRTKPNVRNSNPALHFVWKQIKQQIDETPKTREETGVLMSHFYQQWKLLNQEDRDLCRSECKLPENTHSETVIYKVTNPAYNNVIVHDN